MLPWVLFPFMDGSVSLLQQKPRCCHPMQICQWMVALCVLDMNKALF